MRTLYIHAGAHKTASSMLQSALREDNEILLAKGLRVIFRSQVINRKLQKCLNQIVAGSASNDVLNELREDLEKILPKRDVNCLLTNEDIFSSIDLFDFYENIEVALAELKKAAEELGWNVKFIFYVRAQSDYIESMYLQHIHLGRSLSFGEFLKGRIPEFLSWNEVLDKAASAVGRDNVIVEPFESIKLKGGKKFYLDFLSSVGVEDFEGIDFDEGVVKSRGANRSYSSLGVEIARKVNPLLNKEERKMLRAFLQENFSTATHERSKFLSESEREFVVNLYAESNRLMFENYLNGYDPVELGYGDPM